jgi:transposase-like protein
MNTKAHCYPKYIILQAVYFKLRFTLSYRDVEEIMKIRGVLVDHATIQRWVYKFTPLLESEMKKRKGRAGTGWRLDETYIKVKGIWCYLFFRSFFPLYVPIFCAEPRQKRISTAIGAKGCRPYFAFGEM